MALPRAVAIRTLNDLKKDLDDETIVDDEFKIQLVQDAQNAAFALRRVAPTLRDDVVKHKALSTLARKIKQVTKTKSEASKGKAANEGVVKIFSQKDLDESRFEPDPKNYTFSKILGNKKVIETLRQVVSQIENPVPNGTNNDAAYRYLMYGPAGTGKTFMAKCLASELGRFGVDTYILDSSDLKGSYKGQTAKNIASLFKLVRNLPGANYAMIFLDEMESLFPADGSGTDAESIMKAQMQEIQDEGNCTPIFIGATNYKNKVPPAILSRMAGIFVNVLSCKDLTDKLRKDFMSKFVIANFWHLENPGKKLFETDATMEQIDKFKEDTQLGYFMMFSNLLAGFSGRDVNRLVQNIKSMQGERLKESRCILVGDSDFSAIETNVLIFNTMDNFNKMNMASYWSSKREPTANTIDPITNERAFRSQGQMYITVTKVFYERYASISGTTLTQWEELPLWSEVTRDEAPKSLPGDVKIVFPPIISWDDIVFYASTMDGPSVQLKDYELGQDTTKKDDGGVIYHTRDKSTRVVDVTPPISNRSTVPPSNEQRLPSPAISPPRSPTPPPLANTSEFGAQTDVLPNETTEDTELAQNEAELLTLLEDQNY